MNLDFALKNGKLIKISEVEKGLACGCVCPSCGSRLIARKGNQKAHHFAHYKATECEGYLETLLHLAAKDIFMEHRKVNLPMYDVKLKDYSKEKYFQYKECILEKGDENIIPDIQLIFKGKTRIFIEIMVTHGIDDEKMKKLERIGVSTLEIDLSYFHKNDVSLSYKELTDILIDRVTHKVWIYDKNSEINCEKSRIYYEDLYRKEEEKRKKREEELRKDREKKEKFIKKYRKEHLEASIIGTLWMDDDESLTGEIKCQFGYVKIFFHRFHGNKDTSPTHFLKYYFIEDTKFKRRNQGALWMGDKSTKGYVNIMDKKIDIEIIKNIKPKTSNSPHYFIIER